MQPVVAPVREQVARNLRRAILEQRFKPGDRLVERELCELTSASRTSVREALRQLESEGLVKSSARGAAVASVDRTEARDLYEARCALEGLAGALCAERADREDLRGLREALAGLRAAGKDSRLLLQAKDRFYAALLAGADNEVISSMLASIHARVGILRAESLARPGRPAEAVRELSLIVRAVAHRDPAAAEEACRNHVRSAARSLLGEAAG